MGSSLPPHWYFRIVFQCWECGHEIEYRERRFTPKPEDPEDRIFRIRDTMHGYECQGLYR